jgi:hypothetical protein
MPAQSNLARRLSALGAVLAICVPLSLALTWGTVQQDYSGGRVVHGTFNASILSHPLEIALLALSVVVILLAVVIHARRLWPFVVALGTLAMAGAAAIILVRLNERGLFNRWKGPGITKVSWDFDVGAVMAVSAAIAGLVVWGALWVLSLRRRCPDCASLTDASALNCPHCGYRFPLPKNLRRCENCEAPVKVEAHVCRYCRYRFDEPAGPRTGG